MKCKQIECSILCGRYCEGDIVRVVWYLRIPEVRRLVLLHKHIFQKILRDLASIVGKQLIPFGLLGLDTLFPQKSKILTES